jgi:hypothetical protein
VADCCLFLNLKLSPTPGLPINCCCLLSTELERCLSTTGGYQTVLPLPLLIATCCLGSRVRHVVSSALRGPFSIVGMLPTLRGLFFLVDVLQTLSGLFFVVDMLPGSPLSGHLPFVAVCLSLLLSLSVVEFLVSWLVQSAPSLLSWHSVTARLLVSIAVGSVHQRRALISRC